MLLLWLLNIVMSSTVDFLWYDFTKWLSDLRSQSSKSLFLEDDGSPVSYQVLITFWMVLNLILVDSEISLIVLFAWCRPIIWQINILSTTTGYVFQHDCLTLWCAVWFRRYPFSIRFGSLFTHVAHQRVKDDFGLRMPSHYKMISMLYF